MGNQYEWTPLEVQLSERISVALDGATRVFAIQPDSCGARTRGMGSTDTGHRHNSLHRCARITRVLVIGPVPVHGPVAADVERGTPEEMTVRSSSVPTSRPAWTRRVLVAEVAPATACGSGDTSETAAGDPAGSSGSSSDPATRQRGMTVNW